MPRFFILFTDKEIRAYRAPVKQERMIPMMDTIQENEIFNLADKGKRCFMWEEKTST